MEFMLTYGWAILVVMIVGIVMWQIGLFALGDSENTILEGFQQLRPIAETCKMSEDSWRQNRHGFQCALMNPLTAQISIIDINVTIDGKYCHNMLVSILTKRTDNQSSYLIRTCSGELGGCNTPSCTDLGGGACGCNDKCLRIPAGSTFFVNAISTASWHSDHPNEPCGIIEPGNQYNTFVDITYDVCIGGTCSTKYSSGHIYGSMT